MFTNIQEDFFLLKNRILLQPKYVIVSLLVEIKNKKGLVHFFLLRKNMEVLNVFLWCQLIFSI